MAALPIGGVRSGPAVVVSADIGVLVHRRCPCGVFPVEVVEAVPGWGRRLAGVMVEETWGTVAAPIVVVAADVVGSSPLDEMVPW